MHIHVLTKGCAIYTRFLIAVNTPEGLSFLLNKIPEEARFDELKNSSHTKSIGGREIEQNDFLFHRFSGRRGYLSVIFQSIPRAQHQAIFDIKNGHSQNLLHVEYHCPESLSLLLNHLDPSLRFIKIHDEKDHSERSVWDWVIASRANDSRDIILNHLLPHEQERLIPGYSTQKQKSVEQLQYYNPGIFKNPDTQPLEQVTQSLTLGK